MAEGNQVTSNFAQLSCELYMVQGWENGQINGFTLIHNQGGIRGRRIRHFNIIES